jgi:hypothetical protein
MLFTFSYEAWYPNSEVSEVFVSDKTTKTFSFVAFLFGVSFSETLVFE